MNRVVAVVACWLAACGPAVTTDGGVQTELDAGLSVPVDAGTGDAGSDDAGPAPDAGTLGADAGTFDAGIDAGTALPSDGGSPWEALRAAVQAGAVADGGRVELVLAVYDNTGLRFVESANGFSPDTRVAVASASKLVSSTLILEAVHRGHLTLQSTTGQVLGWTGNKAAITLEQLLSFTSGLPREASCTLTAATLEACVNEIRDEALVAVPGTRFDYGSTHLAVAGRMVEVTTGKKWNEFFDEVLRIPLNLPTDVAYFAGPRQAVNKNNPLIAGGLRTSVNEYAKLLRVVFSKGRLPQLTIATPALFDAQAKEPFPSVVIGASPAQSYGAPFRYGYGCWLECAQPSMGCDVISSAGAFGFTPWVDRATGYYAILGMEEPPGGVGAYSIPLQQRLQPLIRAALAAHP